MHWSIVESKVSGFKKLGDWSRCAATRSIDWEGDGGGSPRPSDKRKRKITEAKGLTMRGRLGGVANSGIIWVNNVLVPRDCRPMISWVRGKSTTLAPRSLRNASQRILLVRNSRWEARGEPLRSISLSTTHTPTLFEFSIRKKPLDLL